MFAVNNSEGQPPQPRENFFLSSPRGLKSGPQSRFNFTFKKERTLRSKFVADKNDGPLPRIRLALERSTNQKSEKYCLSRVHQSVNLFQARPIKPLKIWIKQHRARPQNRPGRPLMRKFKKLVTKIRIKKTRSEDIEDLAQLWLQYDLI